MPESSAMAMGFAPGLSAAAMRTAPRLSAVRSELPLPSAQPTNLPKPGAGRGDDRGALVSHKSVEVLEVLMVLVRE